MLRPVRLPLLPLDLGPARGVEVSLVACLVRVSAPLSPRPLRELGRGRLLVHSGLPLPALLPRLPLPAHDSTLCDVVSRESLRRSASVLDNPVFSDRGTRKDRRAHSRSASSRGGSRHSRSRSAYRSRSSGRERRQRASSRSLPSSERSGSSDRSQSRRQRSQSPARRGGRRDRSRSLDPSRRSCDRSRSRARSPPSSDRLRSKEGGHRARRKKQEGVETVAVSQAPVVSEASAAVAPPVGGATVATLPSAVQDLTRFFLNLVGSSSLGAVGGVADAAAPASGVGAQLCPSALGGGTVASCAATAVPADVVDPLTASAAVPGSSCRQQRQEVFRSSRRRRRSSSDGTSRAKKRHLRDRSLSPAHSARRREK